MKSAKTVLLKIQYSLLLLCITVHSACATEPQTADLVLLDGKIISVDPQNQIHQALAIRAGKIMAIGTNEEIRKYLSDNTHVRNLNGQSVVPGLFHTHSHAIGAARYELFQKHVELTSVKQVQDWLRAQQQHVRPGEWIQVPRTDITRMKERRHPTPAELDAACPNHPVALNAARKWTLNTRAMEVSKIRQEAKKQNSQIKVITDADGNPILFAGADQLLRPFLPYSNFKTEQSTQLESLARLLNVYSSLGFTSMFDRANNRSGYDMYRTLKHQNQLPIRVTVTFRKQMYKADDVTRFVKQLDLKPGDGDEWVKPGPLKITLDGGIHWGNTYLSEPYGKKRIQFYQLDDPNYRGDVRYNQNQLADVFAAAHRAGWQMSCHVTGDGGMLHVLQALEKSHAIFPAKDKRFTLIHAYFPNREILKLAKAYGVCVDTQIDLYYKDSDAIADIYGKDWAERFIGLKSWQAYGVPVSINGDHMIGFDPVTAMNSFDPFLHLYIAVTRKNKHGQIYGPEQKLSRIAALKTLTIDAAKLSFDEQQLGSLEVGKKADLLVLDRDYLTCPADEISDIKPALTMVAGKVVYQLQ